MIRVQGLRGWLLNVLVGVDDATCRRAGRLEPGICLHLIAKEQAERAAAQSEPEILQSDLSCLLMELLQWGCSDPAQMSWLDQPPTVNLLGRETPVTDAGGAGR